MENGIKFQSGAFKRPPSYPSDTDTGSDHSTSSCFTQNCNVKLFSGEKHLGKARRSIPLADRNPKPVEALDTHVGKLLGTSKDKEKWPKDEASVIVDVKTPYNKSVAGSHTQATLSSFHGVSSTGNDASSTEDHASFSKRDSGEVMRIRSRKLGSSSEEKAPRKRNAKSGVGINKSSKPIGWRSISPSVKEKSDLLKADNNVEVGSSALMIGETVSAVRQMRTEAAILAFRLAEVHAQEAQELRQAATVMRGHVDSLNDEVQMMQVGLDDMEKSRWSWKTALRESALFAGVMGAAIGAEEVARWLRNFASGSQQNSKVNTRFRGGVMSLAALVLVGSRYKSPEWKHMLNALKGSEPQRQSLLEKWRAILHRVAAMTSLAHSEPTSSGRIMESEALPLSNGGTKLALT